jgi:4-hydroxybenzoate polyprenyltransferase
MKNKVPSYLDYFFVLRPSLFFPVWTVSLAGYWAQQRFDRNETWHDFNITFLHSDISYIIAIALFTLVMGASFLINQIEDADSDRLNNKLFLIANGDISVRNAYIETVIALAVPAVLFLLSRIDLLFVSAAAFIVTGFLYSCKPYKMKDRPFGGLVINVLGYYVVFALGWMIKSQVNAKMFLHSTPYALGISAVYFLTLIPDVEGDRHSGKITLAVRYGDKPVLWLGLLTNSLAILAAVLAGDLVVLLPTAAVMPLYILAVVTRSVTHVLWTTRYATLFLSLMICYRFQLYLLLIVCLFFFARWYYKNRFNVNYPSFSTR